MKKVLMMIVNFLISVISFTLAACFYGIENEMLGVLSMILGIVFISLFCIKFGIYLSKQMGGKNSLLIGLASFNIYFLIYLGFSMVITLFESINFVYGNLMLVLFYLSFLVFILCISMIVYNLIVEKKNKKLLYLFLGNAVLLLVFLGLGFIVSPKLEVLANILRFLYFSSMVTLGTFFFVFIGYKIIFPVRK